MIAAVVRAMKEPQGAGAVCALALLLALNILCYFDRYILAAVEPEIRTTVGTFLEGRWRAHLAGEPLDWY